MSNEFASALIALEALAHKVVQDVKPSLVTSRRDWYEFDTERNAEMSREQQDEAMRERIWKARETVRAFVNSARAMGAEMTHEEYATAEQLRRADAGYPAIPLYTEVTHGLGALNAFLRTIERMRVSAEKSA